MCFNARSINNKLARIKAEILSCSPDIICITETWINDVDSLPYSFNDVGSFSSFVDCRLGKKGGGVLMLVNTELRPRLFSVGSKSDVGSTCNTVTVVMGTHKNSLQVTVVYRPSDTNAEDTKRLAKYLANTTKCATRSLITGDFNLPYIDWTVPSNTKADGIHNVFQSRMDELGLEQCVTEPTCGDHMLDLLLVSHSSEIGTINILPQIADHKIILADICNSLDIDSNTVQLFTERLDTSRMNALLALVNWNLVFADTVDVDLCVSRFMNILSEIKLKCTIRVNCKPNRYLPKSIRDAIIRKRKLWDKLKKVKDDDTIMHNYKSCCKEIRSAIMNFRLSTENNLLSSNNNKKFFQFIRSNLKSNSAPTVLRSNGVDLITDYEIAEAFSWEFSSNFSTSNNVDQEESIIADSYLERNDVIELPNISIEIVRKALQSVPNTAAGPDGISGKLLKSLSTQLLYPLFLIFQKSLFQGIFPAEWKMAYITPIYKGQGDKELASSYRPVSLCSTLGKTMERLIRDQLITAATFAKPLCQSQHGFLAGKSTISNLLITDRIVNESLNAGDSVDIISVDFARAFDKVPHYLLLSVLRKRGIPDMLLRWLKSYLSLRKQRVRTNVLSDEKTVLSGVIQGSCLGTTLFVLFIDDLLWSLKTLALAFADDLKFINNLRLHNPVAVQGDLDLVAEWSVAMQMPISIPKCGVIHYGHENLRYNYTLGLEILPKLSTFKDLGVLKSADNDYSEHIKTVVNKSRRLIGTALKSFKTRDHQFLLKLYMSFIRPTLLYASVIWVPSKKYLRSELESVQRRYTKRFYGMRNLSYSERLRRLNILSLESTMLEVDLIWVYKILHGLMDISPESVGLQLTCGTRTRSDGTKLCHLLPHTSTIASRFMFRVPLIWNSLPVNITGSKTLASFKLQLRNWLMDLDYNFIN